MRLSTRRRRQPCSRQGHQALARTRRRARSARAQARTRNLHAARPGRGIAEVVLRRRVCVPHRVGAPPRRRTPRRAPRPSRAPRRRAAWATAAHGQRAEAAQEQQGAVAVHRGKVHEGHHGDRCDACAACATAWSGARARALGGAGGARFKHATCRGHALHMATGVACASAAQ